MKGNMRKETRIGLLLIAIFNLVNFITNELGTKVPVLHFCLGGLAGLAFMELIMGMLPEAVYYKIKSYKKNFSL